MGREKNIVGFIQAADNLEQGVGNLWQACHMWHENYGHLWGRVVEQQIAELLRQNQELIRVLQNRDNSSNHKVTVQFEKFDEEKENFDNFTERFETFLVIQNVLIANRAKVFVLSLSAKLYQLLKCLLAPGIPSDQTLDKLRDALRKHLTPKPLIIPSRHKF
ncbi:uncharacterized protein K02A2.6 [Trichonephila clavipes]|nr:uncharacterized protein K02A2.6 [Trichonephila clavipes]